MPVFAAQLQRSGTPSVGSVHWTGRGWLLRIALLAAGLPETSVTAFGVPPTLQGWGRDFHRPHCCTARHPGVHLQSLRTQERRFQAAAQLDSGGQGTALSESPGLNTTGFSLNYTQWDGESPLFSPAPTTKKAPVDAQRPYAYWKSLVHVRNEIVKFWERNNVSSNAVPNENLLQILGEHGLRHGLRTHGGHARVAELLGVKRIPGKWKDAILCPEVRTMVARGQFGPRKAAQGERGGATDILLGAKKYYPSMAQLRAARTARKVQIEAGLAKWGRPRIGWRPHGFWSEDANFSGQLYRFLQEYNSATGLPLMWMPRLAVFEAQGRFDIVLAFHRYGGLEHTSRKYFLVPYPEWRYLEDTLYIVHGLRDCLDKMGLDQCFPPLDDLEEVGGKKLRRTIEKHGGRALVARRLGLVLVGRQSKKYQHLDWGAFDLDYAISLLEYIRESFYKRELGTSVYGFGRARKMVPQSSWEALDSMITMPCREEFIRDKRPDLLEQTEQLGGFENVARRLRLAYNFKAELGELNRMRTSE